MKKCYWCAEEIQDEARICRYCGRDVVNPLSPTPVSPEAESLLHEQPKPDLGTSEPVKPPPRNPEAERMLHYYPNPDRETNKTVNLPPIKTAENIPQLETKKLPPLKWHQNIFVRAIFFGIGMFFVLSNLLNIGIYFVYYLIFGGIWRLLNDDAMNTDLKKRQSILGFEFFVVMFLSFMFNLFLSYLMDSL